MLSELLAQRGHDERAVALRNRDRIRAPDALGEAYGEVPRREARRELDRAGAVREMAALKESLVEPRCVWEADWMRVRGVGGGIGEGESGEEGVGCGRFI